MEADKFQELVLKKLDIITNDISGLKPMLLNLKPMLLV